MVTDHDELENDVISPQLYEVRFQFNDDESYQVTFSSDPKFFLVLDGSQTEMPEVTFSNGKGDEFKLFMKKIDNES